MNTMGTVVVAFFIATVAGVPKVTIAAGRDFSSSSARAGRRSRFPSANRGLSTRFSPSRYPMSLNPCRSESSSAAAEPERVLSVKSPTW